MILSVEKIPLNLLIFFYKIYFLCSNQMENSKNKVLFKYIHLNDCSIYFEIPKFPKPWPFSCITLFESYKTKVMFKYYDCLIYFQRFQNCLVLLFFYKIYRTRAIISRGLYTFLPRFQRPFMYCELWPYVWLVFKSGF